MQGWAASSHSQGARGACAQWGASVASGVAGLELLWLTGVAAVCDWQRSSRVAPQMLTAWRLCVCVDGCLGRRSLFVVRG